MIVAPPLLAGAVKATEAVLLAGVAVSPVGAPSWCASRSVEKQMARAMISWIFRITLFFGVDRVKQRSGFFFFLGNHGGH